MDISSFFIKNCKNIDLAVNMLIISHLLVEISQKKFLGYLSISYGSNLEFTLADRDKK